jgi:hypothetical protein
VPQRGSKLQPGIAAVVKSDRHRWSYLATAGAKGSVRLNPLLNTKFNFRRHLLA